MIVFILLWAVLLEATSLKHFKDENIKVDEVVSIYNGDTITVTIKEYPSIIGERISIRVNGIDTPEIKEKCANEKDKS